MMDSKQIGNITELEILTYITKLGYQVSLPFGDRERYDQIWDVNGKLLKIQVKTARAYKDGFMFSCRSNTKVDGKVHHKKYSKDEIDFFSTFWNDKCYLVPVEECSCDKKIRFKTPKNNQNKNINLAKDYEVEVILNNLI